MKFNNTFYVNFISDFYIKNFKSYGKTLIPSSESCWVETEKGAEVRGQVPVWVLGKAITSRIDAAPVIIIISLSKPKAMPPCGGAP